MHSTLDEQSFTLADVPTIPLVEAHVGFSRRRSVRRHNEDVLKAARREARRVVVFKVMIPMAVCIGVVGFLLLLKLATTG